MTTSEREGPQQLPARFTCEGCKHLVTEYWSEYLDNDERDSGTDAKCAKADRHISPYWSGFESPPEWCPCPRAPLDGAVATTERLPEKPGKRSYEYVRCLIFVKGDWEIGMWNCEHLCWDDDEGDDFRYHPHEPTHWMPLPEPPAALRGIGGE